MLIILLACQAPAPEERQSRSGGETAAPADDGRLTVDAKGHGNYLGIMDAMADARSGDTIWVAPGDYYGSIRFGGKSVAIRSTGGAEVTTIHANPGSSVVSVKDGELPGTLIEGFTLSGGGGTLDPAVDVEFSALTLRNDRIAGNVGFATVYSRAGHLVLDGTTLEDNQPAEGTVVQARRGEIYLTGTTVVCGDAAVGYDSEHSAAFADASRFVCGGATAVAVYHSSGRIQRSTLDGLLAVENEFTSREPTIAEDSVLLGGASVVTSDLTLRNVVNLGPVTATDALLHVEASVLTGPGCGIDANSGSTVSTRYTDFWDAGGCATDPTGEADFSADPRFVDAGQGDYHLAAGSPCVDAGPPDAGYADPDGSPNDVGAYGGPLGGGW
jgi:hypothetical protein